MFIHLTNIQLYTRQHCVHRKPTLYRNSFKLPRRVPKVLILLCSSANQPSSSLKRAENERNEYGSDTFAKIQKYFEEASQRLGFSQEDVETLSQSLLSTLGIQKSTTPVVIRYPEQEQFQLPYMLILAGYAFESYNEPLPLYCEEMTENCFVAFVSRRLMECFGSGFLVVKMKELDGFQLSKVKGFRLCMGSRVAKFQNLWSSDPSTLREKRKLSNLFQASSSSGEQSSDGILFGCILVDFASEPQKNECFDTLPIFLMQFCSDELATKQSVWAQVSVSLMERLDDLKQIYTLAIRTIAFVGIPFLLRRLLFQILRLVLQYIPKWKGYQDRPFYLLKEYIKPRVIGVAKAEISYRKWNNLWSYSDDRLFWETIQKYQRTYLIANETQRKAHFREKESIKWKELTERYLASSSTMESFDKTELLCMIENIETDTELLIWQQKDSTVPILYIAFRGTEQHSWQDFFTDALVYQQPYFFGDDGIDSDLHINLFKDAVSSKIPKNDAYFQFHQTEWKWNHGHTQVSQEELSKDQEIQSYIEQQLACPFEGPKVHYGFLRSFVGIRETFLQVIEKAVGSKYLQHHDVKMTPILYFTGHSLGGALATLAAGEVSYKHPSWQIRMYNFGSPRVGNAEFVNIYNQLVPHSFRVVNDTDIIARIPRSQNFEYYHVGHTVLINQRGEIWTQSHSREEDPLDDNWSSLQEMLEAEWSLLNSLSKGISLEHHLEAAYLVAMESLLRKSIH
ncbi:Lipase ZK262.3 [Galdieria sulphuraria]|uniref:Triacylglycerol lipase n=1 Tax=Galdieria sulphuraria TaxID=130081 RepID=M2XLA9_GALSU|nr:triacylglycerol lipase [Galdieria sulphuraria]EME30942.1 triacylglycerol lipase [Galdieria sulphuraria]GJD11856.1 Lipase ZK262.3 [Galdieria sulphuraria]|eukprot:XP_005707462.1 triacylglycerol lipase [Galdieria sulphuraria]